jgi:hypothetical protein
MAIADQSTRTTTSKISASNSWVLLGYTFFAAIAIAASTYFIPAGLEVTKINPSQIVGP